MQKTDEKRHPDRDPDYERKRQKELDRFDYYFIRINHDQIVFNVYQKFVRVSAYIAESIKKQTEELTEKSLMDDLSKTLLGLKIKSNYSIKSKCLKGIIRKVLSDYKNDSQKK